MFLMFRSSTRITSKRRAMPVDVFSHQSLRRSVSRAFSRATAIFALPRRADPRAARASLRWRRRSRARSRTVRPGFLFAGQLEPVSGHANIMPDIDSFER
jgi:hypothetical protein